MAAPFSQDLNDFFGELVKDILHLALSVDLDVAYFYVVVEELRKHFTIEFIY